MKKVLGSFFLLISLCSSLYGFERDTNYDIAVSSFSRADIIRVFKYAVHFNEVFKISTYGDENYTKIRKLLELYDEMILAPYYRGSVEILSKSNDQELTLEMLKLLISYENSADEELSYGLAEVYAKNPNLIETTVKEFNIEIQKGLTKRLEESLRLLIENKERPNIELLRKRLRAFIETIAGSEGNGVSP